MRSAAVAAAGEDEDFADDPVFAELLSDGAGALRGGNPGWSSSQFSSLSSAIYRDWYFE